MIIVESDTSGPKKKFILKKAKHIKLMLKVEKIILYMMIISNVLLLMGKVPLDVSLVYNSPLEENEQLITYNVESRSFYKVIIGVSTVGRGSQYSINGRFQIIINNETFYNRSFHTSGNEDSDGSYPASIHVDWQSPVFKSNTQLTIVFNTSTTENALQTPWVSIYQNPPTYYENLFIVAFSLTLLAGLVFVLKLGSDYIFFKKNMEFFDTKKFKALGDQETSIDVKLLLYTIFFLVVILIIMELVIFNVQFFATGSSWR